MGLYRLQVEEDASTQGSLVHAEPSQVFPLGNQEICKMSGAFCPLLWFVKTGLIVLVWMVYGVSIQRDSPCGQYPIENGSLVPARPNQQHHWVWVAWQWIEKEHFLLVDEDGSAQIEQTCLSWHELCLGWWWWGEELVLVFLFQMRKSPPRSQALYSCWTRPTAVLYSCSLPWLGSIPKPVVAPAMLP